MFEVTGKDVEALDDKKLRELVSRLCKAEVEREGLGTVGIGDGGNQNAADGGSDVSVQLEQELRSGSYIPRKLTYFQVKKYKMQPAKISEEMCPKGLLRSLFQELADEQGCYIIISGADDTTDTMNRQRIDAMKSAIGELSKEIELRFYDQTKLANWTNTHPAVVAWVKQCTNTSVWGWKPYSNWTNSGNYPYLVDNSARIQLPDGAKVVSVEDGLQSICSILAKPTTSVRLIGLSGVGKTRFAQALFEPVIGNSPLLQSQVIYYDQGSADGVSPGKMISSLIEAHRRMIVIVDNCTSDEHNNLTKLCTTAKSLVSLLTIEYDVREDTPESTTVYTLAPSSDSLICRLLEQRFPQRDNMDNRRIAHLSGGNSRIAIAIAEATKGQKSLNSLTDAQLFDRLFWQRGQKDSRLRQAAEVCSLVYSFSLNDSEMCELNCLAGLANMTTDDLFRNISLLRKKQLVQCRGKWRAVLPHVLANTLAKDALENILANKIVTAMENSTSHMLRSFSKRLSYLHNSVVAQNIFVDWLQLPPLLNPNRYDRVCNQRLEDAAPVVPDLVLIKLETLYTEKGLDRLCEAFEPDILIRILQRIATDPNYFNRCANLLISLSPKRAGTDDVFSLFQMAYSGTHAPLSQRLPFVHRLLTSQIQSEVKLGLKALETSLLTESRLKHSYGWGEPFGMHFVDSGWTPKNNEEKNNWLIQVTDFILEILNIVSITLQRQIKALLGESLRGIWIDGLAPTVETICNKLHAQGEWYQGWLGLGNIQKLNGKQMSTEEQKRLTVLIELLEPKSIVERVCCLVTAPLWMLEVYFPWNENYLIGCAHQAELTQLAKECVLNPRCLSEFLQKTADVDCFGTGYFFGMQLAIAEEEAGQLWPFLCENLSTSKSVDIQEGYLDRLQAPALAEQLLNEAESVTSSNQIAKIRGRINVSMIYLSSRLQLLQDGKMSCNDVISLFRGSKAWEIEDRDLFSFFSSLLLYDGGADAALNILSEHYYNSQTYIMPENFKQLGRQLILQCMQNDKLCFNQQYQNGQFVILCFTPSAPTEDISTFFQRLLPLIKDSRSLEWQEYFYFSEKTISTIIHLYPKNFLDAFVDAAKNDYYLSREIKGGIHSPNMISYLDVDDVLNWADSSARRLSVAALCDPFAYDGEQKTQWSDLAWELMKSENGLDIFRVFIQQIIPTSWSNSRAAIVRIRLPLLKDAQGIQQLSVIANEELQSLLLWVQNEEDRETKREHERELSKICFEY